MHMKQMSFFRGVVGLVFVIGAGQACGGAALDEAAQPSGEITAQAGILRFPSVQSFDETVSELRRQWRSRDAWERQWPEFTSMRAAFNGLTEAEQERIGSMNDLSGYEGFLAIVGSGEDKEAVTVVEDEALATVLNEDGLVIIENAAFKYGRYRVVKATSYDESRLSELGRYEESVPAEGIEVMPFEQPTRRIFESQPTIAPETIGGSCLNDYWHGGRLCCMKRVVGEIGYYFQLSGFFRVTGKHQRRTSGVWWRDAAPLLRVAATGSITTCGLFNGCSTGPINLSQEEADSGHIEFDINFGAVDTPSSDSVHELKITASATSDDYQYRECSMAW